MRLMLRLRDHLPVSVCRARRPSRLASSALPSERFLRRTTLVMTWCVLATGAVSAFSPSVASRSRPWPPPMPMRPSASARRPRGPHFAIFAKGIELEGLMYDDTARAFEAWEWTAGLGAPAALVAGAVLVTLSETRGEMQPKRSDAPMIRRGKQAFRFLTMSSFALEMICIFVSTVTGTALLGHPEVAKGAARVGYGSPMALLRHHHEFEYLCAQISFLQGLINWLLAVAIEFIIPKKRDNGKVGETRSGMRMNKCLASCLLTLVFWILAFYNNHLNFYSDYASMLRRYAVLFWHRFVWCWPIRPMALFYVPGMVTSVVLAMKAFMSAPEDDDDD